MVKMTYLYTFEDGHQETHIYDGVIESECETKHHNFCSKMFMDNYTSGVNDGPEDAKRYKIVKTEIASKEEY